MGLFNKRSPEPSTTIPMTTTDTYEGRPHEILGPVVSTTEMKQASSFEDISDKATAMGADAIVGLRVLTIGGTAGMVWAAYGTAVRFVD